MKIDYFENGLTEQIFQEIQTKIDFDRSQQFYFHALICFTNSEDKIKELLKFISSKNIYYQPFIIFISNSSYDKKCLRKILRQDEDNFIDQEMLK